MGRTKDGEPSDRMSQGDGRKGGANYREMIRRAVHRAAVEAGGSAAR
jgi:hypothetical protein